MATIPMRPSNTVQAQNTHVVRREIGTGSDGEVALTGLSLPSMLRDVTSCGARTLVKTVSSLTRVALLAMLTHELDLLRNVLEYHLFNTLWTILGRS